MLATGKPEMLACLRSTGLEHPPAAMRGKVEKLNGITSATISRSSLNNDKRAVLCLRGHEILGRSPADPTRNPWGTTPRPEPYVDAKEGAAFLRLPP